MPVKDCATKNVFCLAGYDINKCIIEDVKKSISSLHKKKKKVILKEQARATGKRK